MSELSYPHSRAWPDIEDLTDREILDFMRKSNNRGGDEGTSIAIIRDPSMTPKNPFDHNDQGVS